MSKRVENSVDVLLVCSTGGHLLQLVALRSVWETFDRAWVTFDKSDARSLLRGEQVLFAALVDGEAAASGEEQRGDECRAIEHAPPASKGCSWYKTKSFQVNRFTAPCRKKRQ